LTPQLDLGAVLCHVEDRVIGNDYTFSFDGHRYQIARGVVQAGMRRQRLRVEVRLDGELKARYQGQYLEIGECGVPRPAPPAKANKPVRKDHNAGGRSSWMQGFFDRPSPAAMEVDRRLKRKKLVSTPGKPGARFLLPKTSAREFHHKQWAIQKRKALFGDRLRLPGL